jgi:hypothetical protein
MARDLCKACCLQNRADARYRFRQQVHKASHYSVKLHPHQTVKSSKLITAGHRHDIEPHGRRASLQDFKGLGARAKAAARCLDSLRSSPTQRCRAMRKVPGHASGPGHAQSHRQVRNDSPSTAPMALRCDGPTAIGLAHVAAESPTSSERNRAAKVSASIVPSAGAHAANSAATDGSYGPGFTSKKNEWSDCGTNV